MIDSVVQAALDAVMKEILERMFFLDAENLTEPVSLVMGSVIEAEVAFAGQRPGSLRIRIAEPAARSLAADFLGLDSSELSNEQIGEVICELANMFCGSLLSRLESTVNFNLSSPKLVDEPVHREEPGCIIHSVQTPNGEITAIFNSENSLCPIHGKFGY